MIAAELDRLFRDPPREFGPTPLWWWSGGKVTRERVEWQLRRFADGGIHNLVVINLAPAGPTWGAMADDPAWFSEEWWDRFTDACRCARELGTRIWFYDQIGFSGANLQGRITLDHPEARGQSLRRAEVTVTGGRVPVRGGESVLACYDPDWRPVAVGPDGAVDAADGAALQLITVVPTAFDYLDPAAVRLLIDSLHGEYERRVGEYFGDVIPGSFQDELPSTNAWSVRFAEEFRRRRGYDLLDHLDALFRPGGPVEHKIRTDYYAVRAELTEQALFRPLGEWHTERGLLLGADQSHPARAGYPTQSTQIYTDYFRTHRWYNAAGSDHDGDAKVHSSMAHLYGHDRVWLEAFHSSGWGGTLEDTYDWLLPFLRSGATLYDPHASYFDTAAGWFEWAPPSTDWRQPYWPQYRSFADAVARICSILSQGDYQADVAVLHPTTTAQAGVPVDLPVQHFGDGRLGEPYGAVDRAQQTYLDLCGSNNWRAWRGGSLDAAGIAFDVIDDDSIQRAELDRGRLAVRAQRYRTVILPAVTVLEPATAAALTQLLDAGGRVIAVGGAPTLAAGRDGDDAVVRRLAEHPELIMVEDHAAAVARLDPAEQHVVGDLPLLVRRVGDSWVALVTGTHPNASQDPAGPPARWTDTFDRSRYAERHEVRVRAAVAEAELWNPATGERQPARVTAGADGVSVIEVDQQGAPALLLVWREADQQDHGAERPFGRPRAQEDGLGAP
ncbi:MAG TPA: glycosyl hydrolase, partial [Microlunatus sp.]|nr:glycosyl hydrolase [Microlunatus sp.]